MTKEFDEYQAALQALAKSEETYNAAVLAAQKEHEPAQRAYQAALQAFNQSLLKKES